MSFDHGKLKTELDYNHPEDCTHLANSIMQKICLTDIEKILGEATKIRMKESDLQEYLDQIGMIIEKSFNEVSDDVPKLPKIQFVSKRQGLHLNNQLVIPDGRFCPLHGKLICTNRFLVMIESKTCLRPGKKPNYPWKFRMTDDDGNKIATDSGGPKAVMQSLKRSYEYFLEAKNVYNRVSNMITDLRTAYFLQPTTTNFYATDDPSSDELEGCFTFDQLLKQEKEDDLKDDHSTKAEHGLPEHPFPAIETLVKLIIDASLSSIEIETKSIDVYMKSLDAISILTGAVGENGVGCISAPSTKQTVADSITLTNEDGTTSNFEAIHKIAENDDGTIVMAVRCGGSQMCLKMENSYTTRKYGHLQNEVNVLTQIQHLKGVPKLIFTGTINNCMNQSWFGMVTEPLGVPFNTLPRSFFSSATVAIGLWDLTRKILIDIHDSGFLHCDIKPSNMILYTDGPYIIDYDGSVPNPKLRVPDWGHYMYSGRWAPRNIIEEDTPSIESDHVCLFFSFLDLISNGKLIDLGAREPNEISGLILSVLDESFHHWAKELISIFRLSASSSQV